MPGTTTRRPLPALVVLLVLAALTAIVWWRVLHRHEAASASPAPEVTVSLSCSPSAKKTALPKPAAVHVEVLNGAGKDGLAADVSSVLKARGFLIAGFDTAPGAQLSDVAEIRFGAAARPAATLLAYHVTGAVLVPITRAGQQVDVVLGRQFKALATPAAAAAAVASHNKTC